jgi:hypothetical protein
MCLNPDQTTPLHGERESFFLFSFDHADSADIYMCGGVRTLREEGSSEITLFLLYNCNLWYSSKKSISGSLRKFYGDKFMV